MPTATCESCNASFEVEGTTAVCPMCGKAARVDLSIRVICSCGTTLKAPPKMRGRVIACPRCTRPVPIPRGDEAERAKTSVQIGSVTRWVFALVLVPFLIAIQGDPDDRRRRVERALSTPEAKAAAEKATTLDGQLRAIPHGRADHAVLERTSKAPWLYGAAAFALLLGFVWLSFGTPKVTTGNLLLTCGAMLAAGTALGFLLQMLFPIPAGEDSTGRILLGALAAGVLGELLKTGWVAVQLRSHRAMPRRAILFLGLAGGVGFGAGEAIQVALGSYAGVALPRQFWTLFVSLIALQGAWSGTAAIFLARSREAAGSLVSKVFAASAAGMALHVVFEVLHQKDLYLGCLVAGLASFALFHALLFWTEETEEEAVGGETIRV
jgi:hypothetical protein